MKTSLDTTSIESSELISPPAQSPRASMETLVNQNSLPGSTETLTRPGTEATPTKEADVSVSPTKLGAKGKKRRAPAPPPPGGKLALAKENHNYFASQARHHTEHTKCLFC